MKNLWCTLAILFLLAGWSAAQNPRTVVYTDGASYTMSMMATPGAIQIRTNACLEGWTEQTTWAGKMPLATTVAAGDVGTFGGSDTITPTVATLTAAAQVFTGSALGTHSHTGGTYSAAAQVVSWPVGVPTHSGTAATFSGNALGTHQHELPLHGGTTPRITAGYGTGSSIAGTRSLTNAAQTTAQVVLLSQAVSAGTPAGTVNITNQGTIAWPAGVPTNASSTVSGASQTVSAGTPAGTNGTSAVTGTLNQFDNRSAWVKLIYCVKD